MFFAKMTGNTKRKLAIFIGTSKCLVYAEAKYCASEMPGEVKYYECSRTEYCCAFGCCVSPGLHFHHLWYYWILVIIMFLVCSGGGWWYRYRLQGRYRAAASAIPNRSSNSRTQGALRGQTCQPQQARISYNSARNTVLLHRMWKGPQRNGTSPNFNSNATTSTHYQNMNVVLNDANCPYYQLYGPPPSYETVIAQTRGKTSASTPVSPETATGGTRLNQPAGSNLMTNPTVPPCFAYPCSPVRLNTVGSMDPDSCGQQSQMQCPNGPVRQPTTAGEDRTREDNAMYLRFPQYCSAENITQNTMVRPPNFCVSPLEYHQDRNTETMSPGDLYERPPILHGSPRRNKNIKEHAESSTLQSGNYDVGGSRERTVLRDLWENSPECGISQVHGRANLERYSLTTSGRYGQRVHQQIQRSTATGKETSGEDKELRDGQLFESGTCVRSRKLEKSLIEMNSVDRNNEQRLCIGSFKFVSRRYARSKENNQREENEVDEEGEEEEEEEEEEGEGEEDDDDDDDDEEEVEEEDDIMKDKEGNKRLARNTLGSHDRIFHCTRTSCSVESARSGKLDRVDRVLTDVATSPQSNPSNNVIAGSFVSAASRCLEAAKTNVDSDFESKRRLDRSKSLD